jgi:hypothetical protein
MLFDDEDFDAFDSETFTVDEDDYEYIAHVGIVRRSGRYPWGSGGEVYETKNSKDFLGYVKELKDKGLTDVEIAEGFGMKTQTLRAAKTVAINEKKASDVAMAQRLKDKGVDGSEIGRRLGIPEPTVRTLLAPGANYKKVQQEELVSILKRQVDEKKVLEVGKGINKFFNVNETQFAVALELCRADGYELISNIKIRGLASINKTTLRVLAVKGTTWADVKYNTDKIRYPDERINDDGQSALGIIDPLVLNPKRVGVLYGKDGGAKADGVTYLRPGLEDLSLGGASYAQVRIQVGKGHYIKGMAIQKDGLPDGIDVLFNTNKEDTGNKLDALKELEVDKDNVFGANISRQVFKEVGGKKVCTSVVNMVNEEGDWTKWSKSVSAQVLSKQSPKLAKEQLDMTYERRTNELNEIMSLTNPTLRKVLLKEYSEGVDKAAVHLKAANLPRQGWKVILPVTSLKDTEIYAPGYNNGERVVLIRYPHAGTFEIPELTVNNRHKESKSLLGDAVDAVAINSKVAERLSGADFDGDTVLVIPNDKNRVLSTKALEGLKNFDAKREYPEYPGMKILAKGSQEMGNISNLITDMTIKNAPTSEVVKAVKHSMVVIDANKHKLNYKESEKVNGIKNLKDKYQGFTDPITGKYGTPAATIVSRAGSADYIPRRKPRTAKLGGPINKETGELEWEFTEQLHWKTGKPLQTKEKKLKLTNDAFTLVSDNPTPMERLYAGHSNKLKGLANKARLEEIRTPNGVTSPSAKKVYADQVTRLDAALSIAEANAPRERRAQLIGGNVLQAKLDAKPNMDWAEEKKVRNQALAAARLRVGAKKEQIVISPKEWEAIQAGAISDTKLQKIIGHADMDQLRDLATPKTKKLMTSSKTNRAMSMLALGYTRAEVAQQLGVSVSTLDQSMVGGDA